MSKYYNDFSRMCARLSNCKKGCISNLYLCAEEAVKEYIGDDRKKLMQLKAEAEAGNFYSYSSFQITLIALFISLINLYIVFMNVSVIGSATFIMKKIEYIIGMTALILVMYVFLILLKFIHCLKWRSYIQVAISEIEKQI